MDSISLIFKIWPKWELGVLKSRAMLITLDLSLFKMLLPKRAGCEINPYASHSL